MLQSYLVRPSAFPMCITTLGTAAEGTLLRLYSRRASQTVHPKATLINMLYPKARQRRGVDKSDQGVDMMV